MKSPVDLTEVNYEMMKIRFFTSGESIGLFEQALERLDVRIPDVLSTPESQLKNINELMA